MLLALVLGCSLSASRMGMVSVEGRKVALTEPDGRVLRLVPGSDDPELVHLEGLGLEVTGPRLGRRMWVRQWRVTDGGDGSQPFVGPLRRVGGRWLLQDWSTGGEVILDEETVGGLAQHDGQVVLVTGFVVGPQTVRVVSWRPLEGE